MDTLTLLPHRSNLMACHPGDHNCHLPPTLFTHIHHVPGNLGSRAFKYAPQYRALDRLFPVVLAAYESPDKCEASQTLCSG
jgi:hypothetical protein